jgi:dsDNA-binding SOS-regulon protein
MGKKRVITKYLVSREGEARYAGLTKEELDTLISKGSVECGDEIVVAQNGDEILEIQVVEQYEVNREGDTCYLKSSKIDT